MAATGSGTGTRTRGWGWAGALLGLALACRQEQEAMLPSPQPAPALEAPLASGEWFRLSEQRGKVVLLSFGYTACPDVCPTTLSRLQSVHGWLGASARHVEVVFVSVDPQRDTAPLLEAYVDAFNPRFTGVRLEGEALEGVLGAYHVTATRRYPDTSRYRERPFTGEPPYSVDHTGAYFLIDKQGRLRARLPYTTSVEQLEAAVEGLLAEDGGTALGPRVERAVARLTPANVGAIYLTLDNARGAEDRLVAAESPGGRVELHEVVAQGEVLRMHPRPEGFSVPARGRVELKPGGKHLMLYGVRETPGPLSLTLHFEKAGAVHLSVPVVGPGGDVP